MFGWFEICLLVAAAVLLVLRVLPYWRRYHPLFGAGCMMLLISALFPRAGNPLGLFLFGPTAKGPHLPLEFFGVVWWALGAWLCKSLLDLVLRRTFFPDNDEPQARRLFADLATALIYALAFVGVVGAVFNQPVSTFLATSGVVAVVLGLAFQNTLGDVLAGLAINIERPFGAGDWITLPENITGQVMQVNWRATRLRTWTHDMVVIPNSVAARAIMTNHTRPSGAHRCVVLLQVDLSVAPSRVIEALMAVATASPDLAHGTTPLAIASDFSDCVMDYKLAFAVESFAQIIGAKSDMLVRIADAFKLQGIGIGSPAMQVQMVPSNVAPGVPQP